LNKPIIAIVGAGNLGRVLSGALERHRYVVDEVITRRTKRPRLRADLVWICVPDREIAKVAKELSKHADWRDKVAVHSSGALPASVLLDLKKRGAAVASAHPLNTFVAKSKPDLTDVPFAIEGDAVAVRVMERIARDLNGGADILRIAASQKPLYHAMGAFASPLLIALLANAEAVGKAAGVKDARCALAKILRTTVDNYLNHGAAASFSGPLVRGDVATVRKHLKVLKSLLRTRAVYKALAESALELLPTPLKKL
jgi:predicted short-subunit dehydrogenase-like oxidoreductase (DUF2520 family)